MNKMSKLMSSNNVDVNTTASSQDTGHMKNYDLTVGLESLISVVAAFTVALTWIAITSMNRTKKTPKNVKILSTGLLALDSVATILYSVRRHSADNMVRMLAQFVGVWASVSAFNIVGLMSVERFVNLQWPNFYLRSFSSEILRRIFIVLMLVSTLLYVFIRVGVCFIVTGDMFTLGHIFTTCRPTSSLFLTIIVLSTIICSLAIFLRIAMIIQGHLKQIGTMDSLPNRFSNMYLRQYRSTLFVFIFVLNIVFTGLCYLLFSLAIEVDLSVLQLLNDLVNLCNNVLDTCTYVFWFRECRLQMLNMIAYCFPKLKYRAEQMRIVVFDLPSHQESARHIPSAVDLS